MTARPHSLKIPLAMFALAAFFYLYEFLLRVSPNVLEKELFLDFHLSAREFGLFSSCYYWAYAPLQLPVGALTDKYGPRCLLTLAILNCALSTLALAYTQSFVISCIARFFIGVGSAFAFISCLKIINVWFEPRLFALMTGITLTIGTLGAALGGTPLSWALNYLSWRELLIYLGLLGLVLALLAWWLVKDHNPHQQKSSQSGPGFWRCLKEVIKCPQSWVIGIYAFFVTAPTDAFGGTWGIKYLIDVHGISRDNASIAAVSMTFVGMAIGSSLLGWISEVFNNRKIPMMISSIIAALALSAIVYWPHLNALSACILFFLFGGASTYVLAFVMARRFIQSVYVATAVGFVNMLSMLGSAGLTYLIGWMLDKVHSDGFGLHGEPLYTVIDYQLSLMVLPIFYGLSTLLVAFIKEKEKMK